MRENVRGKRAEGCGLSAISPQPSDCLPLAAIGGDEGHDRR